MRERVKQRVGVVVSAKAAKTVVVRVDRLVQHPLYGKRIRQRTRFMAHDDSIVLRRAVDAAARGALTIPVSATFRLSEAAAAQNALAKGPSGKVLLVVQA